MFDTKINPINFSYKGASYIKDEKGFVRFTGHGANEVEFNQVSLTNAIIDNESVKGTPLWDLIFNPDYDIITIRVNGSIVKIKNYFLRENDHSTVLLFRNKALIKIVITNGDITEYESLPSRSIEKEETNVIAWLSSNNQNFKLHHKQIQEDLC